MDPVREHIAVTMAARYHPETARVWPNGVQIESQFDGGMSVAGALVRVPERLANEEVAVAARVAEVVPENRAGDPLDARVVQEPAQGLVPVDEGYDHGPRRMVV